MKIEDVARICHEANRAYCMTIKDYSQVPWKYAQEWQKVSAISGVEFHLNNQGATPEQSHEQWYNEKFLAGWKYGPEKDVNRKEHPCMVPYQQLPIEHKIKDFLFKGIVESLRSFIDSEEDLSMKVYCGICYDPNAPVNDNGVCEACYKMALSTPKGLLEREQINRLKTLIDAMEEENE